VIAIADGLDSVVTSTDGVSGSWASARSVVRSRRTAGASRRTVLILLGANVFVTPTKLAGGLLSGSAAMLAEAAHSLAKEFGELDEVRELLTMALGPNSLLVAARVDFGEGLDDAAVEHVSERIDQRLHKVVPDVAEVFLDATMARRRPRSPSRESRRL
jgi:divalent metal cation (Fe/Co/Zn/Cd) transporter